MYNIDMDKLYYGAIYETTNQINNKKYIGKLIFTRKNDWQSYLGSGTYLKRAINKYGKHNFIKKILAVAVDDAELNELEEQFIRMFNAVESHEFYNLKYTSVGGDTFTNNPNKEHTRKLKSINASGERNPMFGKPKSQATIDAIKKANNRPYVAAGVRYSSRKEAIEASGMSQSGFSKRIKSKNFPDWYKA